MTLEPKSYTYICVVNCLLSNRIFTTRIGTTDADNYQSTLAEVAISLMTQIDLAQHKSYTLSGTVQDSSGKTIGFNHKQIVTAITNAIK